MLAQEVSLEAHHTIGEADKKISLIESENVMFEREEVQGSHRDTNQKEALSCPWGEMVMINVSWISQTSGGSCSMCLSERLCFIG